MATSIIDTIAQFVSPALTSKLSARTGESASNIGTGLRLAISRIVGGLAARASDPDAVGQIYAMAIDPNNDTSVFDSSERLVSRLANGPDRGASSNFVPSLLFGNREPSVVAALATDAAVSGVTAKILLSIATSLVMGYLGKMIRTEKLDASAFASRLMAERKTRVPSDLRPRSAWAWALPVALAAFGTWALLAFLNHPSDRNYALSKGEPGAVGTSGLVSRELPGGGNLQLPPNGTEARLLSFIQGSAPVTKDTWFELDRLNFGIDSAVLKADSREQLTNIAAILKAYPAAHLKIGGYTDNSGDPGTNQQLSLARAEAVREALRGLGVDASRVEAEGYGDQHPIADNNTADGRAKNRRIAVLVTAK